MTWSIVARDPETDSFGVAVTTRTIANGSRCPWVRAGVGAVSTQSVTNHFFGPKILDGLASGLAPAQAIQTVLEDDPGRGIRQVHCIDRHGRTAAYTGRHCVDSCGHRNTNGHSVAGNMLAADAVINRTYEAFCDASSPFGERLIAALRAGEAVGGDRRGIRSASLLIVTGDIIPEVNLRVDDHVEPLAELGRLLATWRREIAPNRHWSPSPSNPSGLTDLEEFEAVWRANGQDFSFRRGETSGDELSASD